MTLGGVNQCLLCCRPVSGCAAGAFSGVVLAPPTLAVTGSTDGANPDAGLTFDAAGNLYGSKTAGGANGAGVVFEITP